ncbi:MAG: response regulator transcription factor [Nitrospira sp.]|nr:response regulator transcription factor [Nitrospira sp.]MCP9443098.1 response regulator transcription factor [Nitrospira sp.]
MPRHARPDFPRKVLTRKIGTVHTPHIRILLAGPHDIALAGARQVLERIPRFKVIGQATTAAATLSAIEKQTVDLAILDVRLDGRNGIDVCRRIRSTFSRTQVLLLIDSIAEASFVSALQAGTAGILVKSVRRTGLVRAIEAICDGHFVFDRSILLHFVPQLCNQATGKQGNARANLSVQEQRVMALVTEGKTNKEIAVALGLSEKTVKNYLYRVYDKLQVTRRAHATRTFIEQSRTAGAFGMIELGCPSLSP